MHECKTSRKVSVGEGVKQVGHVVGAVLGSVWFVEEIWHAWPCMLLFFGPYALA
jgi:hypothetical protein